MYSTYFHFIQTGRVFDPTNTENEEVTHGPDRMTLRPKGMQGGFHFHVSDLITPMLANIPVLEGSGIGFETAVGLIPPANDAPRFR